MLYGPTTTKYSYELYKAAECFKSVVTPFISMACQQRRGRLIRSSTREESTPRTRVIRSCDARLRSAHPILFFLKSRSKPHRTQGLELAPSSAIDLTALRSVARAVGRPGLHGIVAAACRPLPAVSEDANAFGLVLLLAPSRNRRPVPSSFWRFSRSRWSFNSCSAFSFSLRSAFAISARSLSNSCWRNRAWRISSSREED